MGDTFDWQHHLEAALEACRRAGEIHREHFRSPGLAVQLKADSSPVTQSDRLAEEAIREALSGAAPELGFLGEELGQEGDERHRWIIDPLDGTRNFVAGLPYFAILIGLELDGEIVLGVVHAPALDAGTWWAARGQGAFAGTGTAFATCRDRRLRVSQVSDLAQSFLVHGDLIHLQRAGMWPAFSDLVARVGRTRGFGDWWGHVLVAEGRCDAMLEAGLALHDVAALKPILEEAGGVLLTHRSAPLVAGFQGTVLSCNRNLAEELSRMLTSR
jgi:histidinol-phosphatase